jgi:hypothetical protein
MKKLDSLGDRMKGYENAFRHYLPRRNYVMIRIDGCHFHTYTKGLKRPFDHGLIEDMDNTAKYLCQKIQGAKLAFVQSDEISILLADFCAAAASSLVVMALSTILAAPPTTADTVTTSGCTVMVPAKIPTAAAVCVTFAASSISSSVGSRFSSQQVKNLGQQLQQERESSDFILNPFYLK